MQFTFPGNQKLKSNKDITELFNFGDSLYYPPVRAKYLISIEKSTPPVLAGFSVSKKLFKSAVKRNLLKRRLREAYRLNKQDLFNQAAERERKILLIFIYNSSQIITFRDIEVSVREILARLKDKF